MYMIKDVIFSPAIIVTKLQQKMKFEIFQGGAKGRKLKVELS